VAAGPPEERDDDEVSLAVLVADPFEPTPPFTFCGTETVLVVVGKGDEPSTQESGRWLDANGRSCTVLDLWRWVTHRDGEGDYDAADRVRADIERERAAWAERSRGV
jgi:hypothetical protein